MPLIIPTGMLQAVYEFTLTGDPEPIITTCGHEIDTASGASAADAPNDLFNAFTNNVLPVISSDYYLERVVCYIGNDGPSPIIEDSTLTREQGGSGAAALPQNCAYLFRKRTDLSGRRGRGRMYIPGCNESAVDSRGVVTPATVLALQAAADSWYSDLTSLAAARWYPPVVHHRSEGTGVEPPSTPVTMFEVDGTIATQRRRLRP